MSGYWKTRNPTLKEKLGSLSFSSLIMFIMYHAIWSTLRPSTEAREITERREGRAIRVEQWRRGHSACIQTTSGTRAGWMRTTTRQDTPGMGTQGLSISSFSRMGA